MSIHPTAIVSPAAQLHPSCQVEPYAIIHAGVVLAAGCRIGSHAVVSGPSVFAERNHIYPHACIGGDPQDQKYDGSPTFLRVGKDNIFREFSTVHRGTQGQDTQIGDGNLFMAYSHVAHDCRIGNDNILANGATLGGHVELGNRLQMGGMSAVHQHCRLGSGSMIAGGSMVTQDVPPFTIAKGDRARLHGLNRIGLRRRELPRSLIDQLHKLYKLIFLQGLSRSTALQQAKQQAGPEPEIQLFLQFFLSTNRGICSAHQTK